MLTPCGTGVIVGGEGGDRLTGGMRRQLSAVLLSPLVSQRLTMFISSEHYHHIEQLTGFIERGEVTPAVGRTYGLDEVPAAIDDLASGVVRAIAVDGTGVVHRQRAPVEHAAGVRGPSVTGIVIVCW